MTAAGNSRARSNARTGLIFAGVAVGMVGLAFASVPLYRLFCQVTGYGGTPAIVLEKKGITADPAHPVTIRFDASVNGRMPWRFEPLQHDVTVPLGQDTLVAYRAVNTSDRPVVGTATFNVTPAKAAQYFSKIECFCFTEQRLEPGEAVEMPVTFYVDPAILEDEHARDVHTITLSYTFFEKKGEDGSS
ncbi:cytochrome c oxidase assembly protein [Caenispirillum bisanense]|uniref:Cytochrome c oxidase assembly protein CtaG n=1 Tax=Caenispirillum bisanense TaxID=414052 RepID=A0A286GEV3_9PROT|nr:cytochrome c oxidase assembly protein [Caenispirillum bisanense]SOD94051.1 cytochrome c oxidase assembly protein subunit 11 [Caenispirillum bisanense]